MSGLRIAMVTTFYPPHNFGGDGIAIQRLSRALARRGHAVTVLQPLDAYDLLHHGAEPAPARDDDGVEVVRLRSRSKHLSVLLTQQLGRPVFAGEAIARMLDERPFDVIVYNNVSLAGGPGILARGHAIKLYFAHEHWLVCPTHVLWRHGRERCTGRQCLRCAISYRRPPQLWRHTGLLERNLAHVDAFVAMSRFSRDKHREFGFPRDMEVLDCFLPDAPPGGPVEDPRPQERPYFLFVGRLERIKGLDDVIPLFADDPGADLLIAGDGDHGPALRRLAQGVPAVSFLGRVSPDALDRYYRHALSLIVPSAGFETFGTIVIEAFRHGTPVLARRLGPFPEIVERAQGGLLFDGSDDLRSGMHRLIDDPGLRPRLAAAARAAFGAYWSESAVVPKFLELVRKIARRRDDTSVLRRLQAESNHREPDSR